MFSSPSCLLHRNNATCNSRFDPPFFSLARGVYVGQARGRRVFVAGTDVRAEWNKRVPLCKRSQDRHLSDVMPRSIRFPPRVRARTREGHAWAVKGGGGLRPPVADGVSCTRSCELWSRYVIRCACIWF